MKKGCELCGNEARMYCESDQASLCWDCDAKVHCANFLVAKHSRSLLCHVCQSPTPWKASGAKLGSTISVCESCACHRSGVSERRPRIQTEEEEVEEVEEVEEHSAEFDETESEDEEESSESDYESEEDEEEGEDDGENQVVPWSSSTPCSSSLPPPCTTSSSTTARDGGPSVSSTLNLKRLREDAYLHSDDEDGCCSPRFDLNVEPSENDETATPFGPLNVTRRYTESADEIRTKARRTEILSSLLGFQETIVSGDHDSSAIIRRICELSRGF